MAEVKKSHNSKGLDIRRGPGNGTSFWGDTAIDLPDEGARISFTELDHSKSFIMSIYFGYTSPSLKDYSRSIQLDLKQTIELNDFLTLRINAQAMKNEYSLLFTYGSNMSSERLKDRVNNVRQFKVARLICYKLIFNKKSSKDNSVKANIIKTNDPNDWVWGVIYQISKSDILQLDKFEGKGYDRVQVNVIDSNQEYHEVQTYISTFDEYLASDDLPYDWYKEYIIYGAEENGLPKEYEDNLKKVKHKVDPDEDRRKTNLENVRASR
jgi:gamma-glutamylcyclotransferase